MSPPMPPRTALGLLCIAERLDFAPQLLLGLDEDSDSPSFEAVIAGALVAAVEQVSRLHIKQAWVRHRERLPMLRGRPAWQHEVAVRRPRTSVMCDYEVKTADVLLNRLVATALVRAMRASSGRVHRKAATQVFAWSGLAEPMIAPTRNDFETARRHLDRQSAHYRSALTLAEALILGSATVVEAPGAEAGMPVFNVALMFERFCETAIQEIAAEVNLTVKTQGTDRRALTDGDGAPYRAIRPDVVVRRGNRSVGVFDAKFKPRYVGESKASTDDIFQLFFYMERLRRLSNRPEPLAGFLVVPQLGDFEAMSARQRTVVLSDQLEHTVIKILPLPLVELIDSVSRGSTLASALRSHAPEFVREVTLLAGAGITRPAADAQHPLMPAT